MSKRTYVQEKTLDKGVQGVQLQKRGESKICRVGRHKVVVTNVGKDKRGRTVHAASVIKPNGKLGETHAGHGSVTKAVSGALRKNGVDVKKKRRST